jgi:hypothetical protein
MQAIVKATICGIWCVPKGSILNLCNEAWFTTENSFWGQWNWCKIPSTVLATRLLLTSIGSLSSNTEPRVGNEYFPSAHLCTVYYIFSL